jgi:hypothetical protein
MLMLSTPVSVVTPGMEMWLSSGRNVTSVGCVELVNE